MTRITEWIGLAFVACCIAMVSFVIVGACAALAPFRWMLDAAQRRHSRMCFQCAEKTLDRTQVMQLIYLRQAGSHICSRCKAQYVVDRTMQ